MQETHSSDDTAPGNPPGAASGAVYDRSTLAVPIRVTARYLERRLDAVLDTLHPEPGLLYRHDGLDIGAGLNGDVEVHRRGNTHVTMAVDTITATLPVRILIRPAWKPHVGPLSLPLGIDLPVDIDAEYTVRMRCRPQLDAGYDLRLHATFDYEVDKPVGIEAVGIGISFAGTTRSAAEDALRELADWLNSDAFDYLNFRDVVTRGWLALQRPVTLAPGHQLRLEIEPDAIFALPFRSSGETGVLGLAVAARIRALATDEEAPPPVPLPALVAGEPPQGVTLALPLVIPFSTLGALLREHVANHPWPFEGRHVVLRDIEVSGNDTGELRAKVELHVGSGEGGFEFDAQLTAIGKPRLDIEAQHLWLEDFRYAEAHTDNRLLNFVARVLRPFAGALLESRLNLPLGPQGDRLIAEANARLSEGIALDDGVTLHGKVEGVRLTGLAVTREGLEVMVETHGDLAIAVAGE